MESKTLSSFRSIGRNRGDTVALIRCELNARYYPRGEAFLIACFTALLAWAISAMLLHADVDSMLVRYPLAIAITYPFFVLFLWLWCMRVDWFDVPSNVNPADFVNAPRPRGTFGGQGGEFGGGGATDTWAEGGASSLSEGASAGALEVAAESGEFAPVAFVAAGAFAVSVFVFGLLGSIVHFVWGAPSLLATLMLDAGMASAFYIYARSAIRNAWLGTALSRTLPGFIGLALVFALLGWGMQSVFPEAITLGDVWRMGR
jgi:hypothetical protein